MLAQELTHTIQQNGGAVNSIQPRLFDDRTERQKVEDALKSKDASDVKDIDNVYAATEAERIELLKILVDQWWAGNSDESVMERIWDSFGSKIFQIAATHMDLWKDCFDKGADLDEMDEVVKAKRKFGADVRALAKQYLDLNRTYSEEELQSLGMKNPGATTEEDQARAMNEIKLAAELVKKAQDGQAQRVERADRRAGRPPGQQEAEPLAHLVGGPPGERDRQALLGEDTQLGAEVRDAVGEGAGLAGARAGDNQQRAGAVANGQTV